MSNKNQSSIEWLVEKIQQANPSFKFDALIRQAKAMHKQETINAYTYGNRQEFYDGTETIAEQYYDQTFNNE